MTFDKTQAEIQRKARRIKEMDGTERGRFYMFFDLADLFWPDDFSKSNHAAEKLIITHLVENGCQEISAGLAYDTPKGRIYFDSESGCFECHAPQREPVEYVEQVIEDMLNKRQTARESLS